MPATINIVRQGFYLDSVGLMQMSRKLQQIDGVEDAALMMGTPANHEILSTAGLLNEIGGTAGAGDLVIAVRAIDKATAQGVQKEAVRLLDAPKVAKAGTVQERPPRTLRSALKRLPGANLALISVPGDYAAAEARKALNHGLHTMIFSDNVPIAAERRLKELGATKGLLVMGPDCGTAIINGTPLAFANRVPRGPIGIVGASGTGIQEVTCLIAKAGSGISHAFGTGGRDLKDEIGGITTRMAMDILEQDAATETIVIISKPPSRAVAYGILEQVERSAKKFVICFLGMDDYEVPPNAVIATTLKAAALAAVGANAGVFGDIPQPVASRHRQIVGLFAGGTLCAEAQLALLSKDQPVASNVPVPGANPLNGAGHKLIDLGDDEYTKGKPHPMIDPSVRDEPFAHALSRSTVGVILIDLVLGQGGHADPAGAIKAVLDNAGDERPLVVGSVTGTEEDPQSLGRQVRILQEAGVIVAPSNADAAALALACSQLRAMNAELPKRILLAIGGNATHPEDIEGTSAEQEAIAARTAESLLPLAMADNELIITHGNGPVVGKILMRQVLTRERIAPMPLDICVAHSQGGIAYLLMQALENALREADNQRHVACLLTQVEVDPDDPAFQNPTKPIGPFFTEAEAREISSELGWRMNEDAGRGWRHVVPSPKPRHVCDISLVQVLARRGTVVIAGGGGGIPVVRGPKGVRRGVAAVIDKDLTSAHMANVLGIDTLMLLTAVDKVAIDWGKPGQRDLDVVSLRQIKAYQAQGQFPPGSMGPKIDAAIRFIEGGGEHCIIGNLQTAMDALHGRSGTHIIADDP